MRKKTSQLTSIEDQLDEKTAEFSITIAKLREIESDMRDKEDEVQRLQSDLREKKRALQQTVDLNEQNQRIHKEQTKDYQKQIDLVLNLFISVCF